MSRLDDRLTTRTATSGPAGRRRRCLRRSTAVARGVTRLARPAGALTVVVMAGSVGGAACSTKRSASRSGGRSTTPVRDGLDRRTRGPNVGSTSVGRQSADRDATPAQLTTDRSTTSDASPAVSPDGHTVAFVRTDGWIVRDLHDRDRRDGHGEALAADVSAMAPAWSPDGTRHRVHAGHPELAGASGR